MDWNQEKLQFLSQCFLHALSPNPEPRRLAESKLAEAADRPNYGIALLRLVSEPSVEEPIRQTAAVNFKNHLRSRWSPAHPSEPNELAAIPMNDSEKELIKSSIVTLMLSSTPLIQSQLSEALAIIGKHDFPKLWPGLLPELVSGLQKASLSSDYASINGILSTANSIFKKFRYQYKTNDLLLDLKYCLDNFAAPLLEIFLRTAVLINSTVGAAGTADTLRPLIESQRLCCRIFFSLNFQELPEFFEDHMKEWMTEFEKYLTTTYQSLEGGSVKGVALVDELRSAVCENITLYMEKNEEEFQGFLNAFARAVWSLLANVSTVSGREKLTITAIKFLTTVSTSVHHSLFAGEGAIQQIFRSIVIPNVQVRDEDEELFEMNYVEFIRRDMEGSDLDTRRRSACELIKGLTMNYKDEVTRIISSEIQNRISSFSMNPSANWKDKESAIYLIVSLASKNTRGHSVSTGIVDFDVFFASVIGPELRSLDVNSFPMLKAGALKFFTLFRNQIVKSVASAFFPEVIRFLSSESNVVHSYAAICIEKLLLVKEEDQKPRFSAADVSPVLLVLMGNLFNALKFQESEENPYVMKCIMRVLGVAEISPNVAAPCITGLTSILNEVCKNPKTPTFNHYLFESVAVLVRRACEKGSTPISDFETTLFPSLQMILANNVTEFFPYAFQLLAQLVELNKPPIPASYMQIFGLLLLPDSWKRKADVPALVHLLQAFLQKASHDPNLQGRLSEILGIFKMLVDSPATDQQGLYVLNTITENVSYDVISSYMTHIWFTLLSRLQSKRTLKFVKSFLVFMSLFLVKHNSTNLVNSMNAVQPDIFSMILKEFWVPHVKLITGAIELKLMSVASTRILCECPVLLDSGASMLWGKLLDNIVTLLSQPEESRVQEEPEILDFERTNGYTTTFVPLYNAGKKEEDPLAEIKDPKEYLVASLANLSSRSPGRYPQIIKEHLDPANQTALLQFCTTYKLLIL